MHLKNSVWPWNLQLCPADSKMTGGDSPDIDDLCSRNSDSIICSGLKSETHTSTLDLKDTNKFFHNWSINNIVGSIHSEKIAFLEFIVLQQSIKKSSFFLTDPNLKFNKMYPIQN